MHECGDEPTDAHGPPQHVDWMCGREPSPAQPGAEVLPRQIGLSQGDQHGRDQGCCQDHSPSDLAFGRESAALLRNLANIEAGTDHRDRHVKQQRCPDHVGEGMMQEVGDEHARLHRPLESLDLGSQQATHDGTR